MVEESPSFAGVLRWLDGLKQGGVITDYAITGAVAASIWGEAVATQDLDVAVILAQGAHSPLDPLRAVLDWAAQHGYPLQGEHIVVHGVPVQLLPSWHPVVEEAIHNAVNVPYDTSEGAPMMRLINPTYLVASWRIPGANTATRAERAARLKDAGLLDETLLADLVARFSL